MVSHLCNKNWLSELDNAMRHFKDESFIAQFLSPHLIRELKLFHIVDDEKTPEILINAIHNEEGYKIIREALAKQYNLSYTDLDIQVFSVDMEGDRSLTLHYTQQDNIPLGKWTLDVMKHLHFLWKFPVNLKRLILKAK